MKRFLENILALASGVICGLLGVLIHNLTWSWFPYGLVIALLGGAAATKMLGARFGRRGVRFWFLFGWIAIVLRGSIFGNGDELLVMANGTGNAFLALGFLLMAASIWSRL